MANGEYLRVPFNMYILVYTCIYFTNSTQTQPTKNKEIPLKFKKIYKTPTYLYEPKLNICLSSA